MNITTDNRFYVVEFLDFPYKDIDQYVCIPGSWIQFYNQPEKLAIITYPVENSSKTKQRVVKGEAPSKDWSVYMTNVKYRTEVYENAKKFIEMLENQIIKERIYLDLTNGDDEQNIPSSTRIDKTQRASLNDNVEPVSEQPPLTDPRIASPIERNDSLIGETHNKSSVNHDFNTIKELSCSTDISNVMKLINKLLEITYSMHNHLRDVCNQNCTTLKQMMTFINKYYSTRSNNPNDTTFENMLVPLVKEKEPERAIERKRQVVKETQAETEVTKRKKAAKVGQKDDNGIKEFSISKRRLSRMFTLPPDYDETDSKWTLKYRVRAPGLVELTKNTGVYLNADKLIKINRSAKDSKTLVRFLLDEIFTDNALRTCSVTGTKSYAYDVDGSRLRPGLDKNARTVLVNYVEDYARDKNWTRTDRQSILSIIRSRLYQMRIKSE